MIFSTYTPVCFTTGAANPNSLLSQSNTTLFLVDQMKSHNCRNLHMSIRQPSSSLISRCCLETVKETRKDVSVVHGVSETIVGVLGGGQLGRMLCQAASRMGIKVITLDPMENCPASAFSYQHVVGSFTDGDMVRDFAKRCGVLTFEIEHVDADTLEELEKQGINCEPKASTIRIIQDKYLQKVHISRHGIPVTDFVQIDSLQSCQLAGERFGYPLMIKSKRLAYDGRGNAVAHSSEDIASAISALGGYDRGLYVERWTPFVKELAVIVARGRAGTLSCYSVVETTHKDNICHIVEAPAHIPEKIRKLSVDVAQKAVRSLDGAGVFAVELFLTTDGQVLLNEVAPRPHNSGHHTIESCYTSQYEQHLRAVLGLPLGDPSMKVPAAIMYNLLGEDEGELGFYKANLLINRALSIPGFSIHWYDKPEMRKSRKMGHMTIVGPSMSIIKRRLDMLLSQEATANNVSGTPLVGIIMGSDSDLPVMKGAAEVLRSFGVPFEVTIVSAHRTPERMYSYAQSAVDRGIKTIIAGAGGAAHLPGMVASLTPLPVIGVPVKTSSLSGMDSLLSIVQMPKGVPVATVAIGNSANAALLAVKILATSDADLLEKVVKYQEDMKDAVLAKAEILESVGWETYNHSGYRLCIIFVEAQEDASHSLLSMFVANLKILGIRLKFQSAVVLVLFSNKIGFTERESPSPTALHSFLYFSVGQYLVL